MKITDLSKCKNFYCPPEVQFIELRIERGFAESSYSATETWPGEKISFYYMWPCSLGVVLSVKFLYERFFDGTPLLRENRDTHRNSGKRDYPDLC